MKKHFPVCHKKRLNNHPFLFDSMNTFTFCRQFPNHEVCFFFCIKNECIWYNVENLAFLGHTHNSHAVHIHPLLHIFNFSFESNLRHLLQFLDWKKETLTLLKVRHVVDNLQPSRLENMKPPAKETSKFVPQKSTVREGQPQS